MLIMLRYQLICIFVVHINKKQGFLTTRLICVCKMKVMNVHIVQTQNESTVSFICCTSIAATLKKILVRFKVYAGYRHTKFLFTKSDGVVASF